MRLLALLLVLLSCWRGGAAAAAADDDPQGQQQQLALDEAGSGFVPSGRMCEEGGYCSVGVSKLWQGDIARSELADSFGPTVVQGSATLLVSGKNTTLRGLSTCRRGHA